MYHPYQLEVLQFNIVLRLWSYTSRPRPWTADDAIFRPILTLLTYSVAIGGWYMTTVVRDEESSGEPLWPSATVVQDKLSYYPATHHRRRTQLYRSKFTDFLQFDTTWDWLRHSRCYMKATHFIIIISHFVNKILIESCPSRSPNTVCTTASV